MLAQIQKPLMPLPRADEREEQISHIPLWQKLVILCAHYYQLRIVQYIASK